MSAEQLYAETERMWEAMGRHGRVCANLLFDGHDDAARKIAADYTAARDLWVEFGQQLRDVRRAVAA